MTAKQFPYNESVGPCTYGAPMGRNDTTEEENPKQLTLRRVPFVDGDYDAGGAYWGRVRENPLWCLWSPSRDVVRFFRAAGWNAAVAKARDMYHAARIGGAK